jgi:aquaporin Z
MSSPRPAILADHLPEYSIEALCLGLFMVSAGVFTTAFEYPGWWLRGAISSNGIRRALEGIAMGLTAIALIYSPWGRRSGAHMNPAVTLAFLRLRKMHALDAMAYILAQFIGGLLGVLAVRQLLGTAFTAPPVSWIITMPGSGGAALTFLAEAAISAGLMFTVLGLAASRRWSGYTGIVAGALVALYITFEAPLSGMSMNPARSFASAASAMQWQSLWIYCLAPILGMQLAAQLHLALAQRCPCAKLMHTPRERCIHCGYEPAMPRVLP